MVFLWLCSQQFLFICLIEIAQSFVLTARPISLCFFSIFQFFIFSRFVWYLGVLFNLEKFVLEGCRLKTNHFCFFHFSSFSYYFQSFLVRLENHAFLQNLCRGEKLCPGFNFSIFAWLARFHLFQPKNHHFSVFAYNFPLFLSLR